MKKLPKKFKEKWLNALRSGDNKQITETLYKDGGYCCLGLACKIIGKSNSVIGRSGDVIPYSEAFDTMPNMLRGAADDENLVGILTSMNDGTAEFSGDPKSFKQIANYIEKNL